MRLRCGLQLPNARALAPLTNTQSAPDGVLREEELRWLVRRARGGFGVVSTCAAFVSEEGHAWRGQLGVSDGRHLPGLRRLAGALADAGSVPIVQLHHGGVQALLAPDPIAPMDTDTARAATEQDLARVTDDFVAAALRAEAAGFAGVEVHGANGYLFTQFLAPADNLRSDAWGDGLVGRAKLLRDTVRAVRAAVAPSFAVGVRLSPVDTWAQRGLRLDDGVQVAVWMAEDGVDFVHLSLQQAWGSPPHEAEPRPVARVVRDALPTEVSLWAAGGIGTRADEQRARDAGVDVAVVGRAAIRHPDWPRLVDAPGFAPEPTPWSRDDLAAVDVSPAFLDYLARFPGLVEGGARPR